MNHTHEINQKNLMEFTEFTTYLRLNLNSLYNKMRLLYHDLV